MNAAHFTVPDGPAGLLLSRDLFFTTKVVGTAQALGFQVVSAGNGAMVSALLAKWRPAVVFVDLAAGDLVTPSALIAHRAECPGTPFIAFGSHVDADALRAARDAGCEEVMPRSRFSAELAQILRRQLAAESSGLDLP